MFYAFSFFVLSAARLRSETKKPTIVAVSAALSNQLPIV